MSKRKIEQNIELLLYATRDPAALFQGAPVPALTTLLYGVCDNDPDKFNEAVRLVRLFITDALEGVKEPGDV
jgi:hypothetical protein